MNLNQLTMGNGTFRAASVWPYGSPGSYLGDGWGAVKHFFTSNTSPSRIYDPNREYDFFRDHYRIPYDQEAVATIVRPHMEKAEMPLAERDAVIARLQQVIKMNEKFEADVTDYYGTRVSRTSGGKRDRLRAERAAIRGESQKARQIAAAAITDFRLLKISEVRSGLKTDPDLVVETRDPSTGAIVYSYSAPGASPAKASAGAGGMGWLLPVGAGVAAYLMMKG